MHKMKKLLLNAAIVLATLLLTNNSYAGNYAPAAFKKVQGQKPPHDTPYFAIIDIVRTGKQDTPYLHTSVLYSNMQQVIDNATEQPALYRVALAYYNRYGQLIGTDEYFIDRRNGFMATDKKSVQ